MKTTAHPPRVSPRYRAVEMPGCPLTSSDAATCPRGHHLSVAPHPELGSDQPRPEEAFSPGNPCVLLLSIIRMPRRGRYSPAVDNTAPSLLQHDGLARPEQLRPCCVLDSSGWGHLAARQVSPVQGHGFGRRFRKHSSAFLGAAALLAPVVSRLLGGLRGPQPLSGSIFPRPGPLASASARQWADEERLRRINDPRPLPVRWETGQAAAHRGHRCLTAWPANSMTLLGCLASCHRAARHSGRCWRGQERASPQVGPRPASRPQ